MKPTPDRKSQTDKGLNAMMALFREENYFKRLKRMWRGLHAPHDTRDYKAARIELQRLAAPTAALVVPVLAVLLLVVFAVGRMPRDEVIINWFRPEKPAPLPPLEPIKEKPLAEPTPTETSYNPVDNTGSINAATPETPSQLGDAPPIVSPVPDKHFRALTGPPSGKYGPRGKGPNGRDDEGPKWGIDPRNDTVILRALRWLKKNQQPDGSWSQHQTAMTGLAILTFLAHDERPDNSPEFGATVQKGIEYLLKAQDARGFFPGNYDGLIATYALCEAAGMTQNPNVKQAATKAVAFIIAGQHANGGFDYGMQPGDRDDTSVMGWAVQALKAARIAELRVDGLDRALKLAVRGFRKNAAANGGFGYIEPGQSGLSGVGVLAFQMLNAADAPEAQKTLNLMDAWKVSWSAPVVPGNNPQYYFYYATQVMFQAGGKRWLHWNEMMKAAYIDAQKIEPQAVTDADGILQDIGWWENHDQNTDRPVMDTCLTALQLMVYYRYLPTFQPPVTAPPVVDSAHGDARDVPVHSGVL